MARFSQNFWPQQEPPDLFFRPTVKPKVPRHGQPRALIVGGRARAPAPALRRPEAKSLQYHGLGPDLRILATDTGDSQGGGEGGMMDGIQDEQVGQAKG